jgi:ATP-binding cassette, subfamily B, bacterial PglK
MNDIRMALRLLGVRNRRRWMALSLLALVSTGVEALGAALVFLLLRLISQPQATPQVPLLGDLGELFALSRESTLLLLTAAMAIFFAFRAALHMGEVYAQNRVAHMAGADLAHRMVQGYLDMPYTFHLQRTSSDLIRNSHQAVKELVGQIFLPVIRVTAESILVLGMLVVLVILAPLATALAVLVVGGAAAALLFFVQPRLRNFGKTAHQMERRTLEDLQESLQSVRDIKMMALESTFATAYKQNRFRLAKAAYARSTIIELPKSVMELALLAFMLGAFGVAVYMQGDTQEAFSTLGLFGYAGIRLQPSIQKIIAGLNNLKFASAPLTDLDNDLAAIKDQRPAPGVESPPGDRSRTPHRITFESVSFRYPTSDRTAVDTINLEIHKGQVIGLCGPTGGGKSTVLDLFTGLIDPTRGRITLDGTPLSGMRRVWQQQIGAVPQMVLLSNTTLRANIAFGVPEAEIDADALRDAVQLSQLSDIVESLPDGLDTVVGERGIRLSGGQRQRIAIARALYKRPSVLVMDEGTSALDNATEAALISAIRSFRDDLTVVMIAHRLSTVRQADRIFFIANGRIESSGTYDDLVETSGGFRSLTQG